MIVRVAFRYGEARLRSMREPNIYDLRTLESACARFGTHVA